MSPVLKVNFRDDWKEFLERTLADYDLSNAPSQSVEENTVTYFNAKRRIARNTGRVVHESRELCIPKQHHGDYSLLKRITSEGGDLKPYLSRDIQKKRADKNDSLLNAWGIQHLHFQPEGTRDVLFVRITDSEIFALQALPHGHGHSQVWVNTTLLEILHDNWLGVTSGKVVGVPGESLTATQRTTLRRRNVNFATAMRDGTVYVTPGGGTTMAGHCFSDIRNSAQILSNLTYWQKQVEANEGSFRAALGIFVPSELSIKMVFDKEECWLYEPTKQAKLSLRLQK